MGSVELQRDVAALAPAVHVFGHSHMRCDATLTHTPSDNNLGLSSGLSSGLGGGGGMSMSMSGGGGSMSSMSSMSSMCSSSSSSSSDQRGVVRRRVAVTRYVQSSLGYPSEHRGGRAPSTDRLKKIWPAEEEALSFY